MAALADALAAARLGDEQEEEEQDAEGAEDAAAAAGGFDPAALDEGAWDDSALVHAYDAAVRRYQEAHGLLPAGGARAALRRRESRGRR